MHEGQLKYLLLNMTLVVSIFARPDVYERSHLDINNLIDGLKNEVIDDIDIEPVGKETINTGEKQFPTATSTVEPSRIFQEPTNESLYLEPPRPSNATHIVASSYETLETPLFPNPVVQKVEPQTTPTYDMSPTPDSDFLQEPQFVTTETIKPSKSDKTISTAPVPITQKPLRTETTTTTTSTTTPIPTIPTTSLCPVTDSIVSPPELPIKTDSNIESEEILTPIWIKIINGMRCSMRDCHGVLVPTEAYPVEEHPTIPMTRFIRGESHNVLPPCPCNRRTQPMDMIANIKPGIRLYKFYGSK